MIIEKIFFLLFAAIAIVAAFGVISFKNPVHSALSLIMCLLQVACIFVLLRAPFLAVAQVFIYVGAVMVLFLFVVLVLDLKKASMETLPSGKRWFVYLISPLVLIEMFIIIFGRSFAGFVAKGPNDGVEIKVLSKFLFTKYLLPFEVVSLLLLAAMVGAIIMAKKNWE